jgi:hypothetical protein
MHASQLGRWVIVASLTVGATACGRPVVAPMDPGPATPEVEYLRHQEILTPLPLRVRLPARYGAERVLVFVRTWGSGGWSMVELARAGQTWSGEVSCREVSTVTGDTRYFFLAIDGRGSTVVGSGSPDWPHVATIVGALPDGPQSLAGDAPLLRCHDPADCPPDFPGCPAYALVRPPCASHDDCGGGMCAWDGFCDDFGASEALAEDADEDDQLEMAVQKALRRYRAAARNDR